MGVKAYYFDSYALFEILTGNPRYLGVVNECSIITTRLNVMELHYHFLKRHGKEAAEKAYEAYRPYVHPISDETIKEANEFRKGHTKKKFSFIDCIGYVMARQFGMRFLTGDIAFKGVPNVKFVR